MRAINGYTDLNFGISCLFGVRELYMLTACSITCQEIDHNILVQMYNINKSITSLYIAMKILQHCKHLCIDFNIILTSPVNIVVGSMVLRHKYVT